MLALIGLNFDMVSSSSPNDPEEHCDRLASCVPHAAGSLRRQLPLLTRFMVFYVDNHLLPARCISSPSNISVPAGATATSSTEIRQSTSPPTTFSSTPGLRQKKKKNPTMPPFLKHRLLPKYHHPPMTAIPPHHLRPLPPNAPAPPRISRQLGLLGALARRTAGGHEDQY